jgi:2-polyprenyl-3-methyl-5-hydroxy-6-metoxy-1,4-benzoquinol methylase
LKGGSVPYSKYPYFQTIQSEETSRIFNSRLIDQIVPLAGDGLIQKLITGVNVLDIGCGRGHALNLMAKLFPKKQILWLRYLQRGNRDRKKRSPRNGFSKCGI